MFGRRYKDLKAEVKGLKAMLIDQDIRLQNLEHRVNELLSDEYFDWKSQMLANKDSANKQGHFFLSSKTDTLLLEKVISEINKEEDLCALFTTADGTTLSLRVSPHPTPAARQYMNKFNGDER